MTDQTPQQKLLAAISLALETAVKAAKDLSALLDPPVVTTPPVVTPPVVTPGFLYYHGKELQPPASVTGTSFTQPSTGAVITKRVEGKIIDYSRFPRTSIDNKYLLVHGENSTSSQVLLMSTGAVVLDLPKLGEVNELRWSYATSEPSTLYYVTGMQFRKLDVATGTDSLVRDFKTTVPAGTQIFTDVEGDCSNDSRFWAWMVRKEVQTGSYPVLAIISYDKQTGAVKTANAAQLGRTAMGRPNMVEASPSGKYVIIHWGKEEGCPQAWKQDLSAKVRNVAVDQTHSGWILGSDGGEWFVSQNNQNNVGQLFRNDYIEAVNLDTGVTLQLLHHGDIGWNNGMHFSKGAKGTNTCLVSTYSPTNAVWGENQLFLLSLSGKITRVASTYNVYPGNEGYRNEASACVSADGRYVHWTTNWGNGNGTRCVAEILLPSDVYTR